MGVKLTYRDGYADGFGFAEVKLHSQLAEVTRERDGLIVVHDMARKQRDDWKSLCNQNNVEIGKLRAELEANKLKWKTGTPPGDGWYWTDPERPMIGWMCRRWWEKYKMEDIGFQWAGPIELPEEE